MPHFVTFDNFTSKTNVYDDGSGNGSYRLKDVIITSFDNKDSTFQPSNQFASKAIVHPQFQQEADGFMKLDDIRGELFHGNAAGDPLPTEEIISNHCNRSNWDVICDVGTSIKQTNVADALTNYRLNGDADHNGLISDITVDPKTGVINGPLINPIIDLNETYDVAIQSLSDDMMTGFMKLDDIRGEFDAGENEKVDVTYRLKDVIITSFDNDDTLTNGGSTPLQENCANGTFLQENCANGTFLQENCANGNWLDKSSTKYNPGKPIPARAQQGEGSIIIESIVNKDNMQGLDAGGMNYAEAVGLDSSTIDVVSKVISTLQPANEFI